jgi:hypothetical protein
MEIKPVMYYNKIVAPSVVTNAGIPEKPTDEFKDVIIERENYMSLVSLKMVNVFTKCSIEGISDVFIYYAIDGDKVLLSYDDVVDVNKILSHTILSSGIIYEIPYEDLLEMTIMRSGSEIQALLSIDNLTDLWMLFKQDDPF